MSKELSSMELPEPMAFADHQLPGEFMRGFKDGWNSCLLIIRRQNGLADIAPDSPK